MTGRKAPSRWLLKASLLLILTALALLLPHLPLWGQGVLGQPRIPESCWYGDSTPRVPVPEQPGQADLLLRIMALEKKLDKLLKEMEGLRQELHNRQVMPYGIIPPNSGIYPPPPRIDPHHPPTDLIHPPLLRSPGVP